MVNPQWLLWIAREEARGGPLRLQAHELAWFASLILGRPVDEREIRASLATALKKAGRVPPEEV